MLGLALTASVRADAPPEYDRDIKPLLERHCFECHGSDEQKGGLRLDRKADALKGGDSGEVAIVPGSSHKSLMVQLVTSSDPKKVMPRKGAKLTTTEVDLLRKWIDTGAHWTESNSASTASAPTEQASAESHISERDRQFWSFVPPKASEPPAALRNAAWARTRIDRFALAKMEAKGLTPSPDAPRQVLIRRLTFDLTGLPPTPEEVEAFVYDNRPDAYERLVDRLLASPRFGERMASLWLPLARYAEDQAHQVGDDTKFFYPNAWRYRQWVIDAFNRDLPYDRFVQYQIAADQIDGAQPSDLAALGFLGLGPKYYNRNRIDVQAEEWEDRVDVVSRTMLGLTVACARCHDHKFDPIPTSDYYAMAGVFAGIKLINKVPGGEVQKGEQPAEKVDPNAVHMVEDAAEPKDLNVFVRGNPDRKGPVVHRHFLSVLSPSDEPVSFTHGSGRKDLALAIADRHNPLTARVIVNRVWGMMFGQPIVPTPSNFGHSGMLPSQPELLDDLAVRFMDDYGWSIKDLVRNIAITSLFMQSASMDAHDAAIDPVNELLWRTNRRRLTVEQWRDGILAACGKLDLTEGKSTNLDDPANLRRTVYARVSRLKLNDLLMHFDYPDANVPAERRSVTNTPAQKLFMLNSRFMLDRARDFAARLESDVPGADDAARVRRAYQLLFARDPDRGELGAALDFLHRPADADLSRWQQYAQILLASNEALYVD